MKTSIVTIAVLLAFVTPSFATDSLHLLAQVNHLMAEGASAPKDKAPAPKPAPQRPK